MSTTIIIFNNKSLFFHEQCDFLYEIDAIKKIGWINYIFSSKNAVVATSIFVIPYLVITLIVIRHSSTIFPGKYLNYSLAC